MVTRDNPLPRGNSTTHLYTGEDELQSIPVVYQPIEADEATIRAREALIASGYFPSADEIIREGRLDHTYCFQIALQLQHDLATPLAKLDQGGRARLRALKPGDPPARTRESSILSSFWMWCARIMRQLQHAHMRHSRLLQRAESLERTVSVLRSDNSRYREGHWINGEEVLHNERGETLFPWRPITGAITGAQSATTRALYAHAETEEDRKAFLKLFNSARAAGDIPFGRTLPAHTLVPAPTTDLQKRIEAAEKRLADHTRQRGGMSGHRHLPY